MALVFGRRTLDEKVDPFWLCLQRDYVAMKEKGRHSRESRNPENLKKMVGTVRRTVRNKRRDRSRVHAGRPTLKDTLFFNGRPSWMPASAGMTDYDTVSRGGRCEKIGICPPHPTLSREGKGKHIKIKKVTF